MPMPMPPAPAYQWSAELTVYLRQEAARQGWAPGCTAPCSTCCGFRGCAHSVRLRLTAENAPSVAFHQALGFREAGRFAKVGYKHGRWLDVLWLEKSIAPHGGAPAPGALPQVEEEAAAQVLHHWGAVH